MRLPGLPWSPQFMAAYEMALGTAPAGVGAERNRPGSVASAVASYFGSTEFCDDLAPSTQAIRRVLLEKFRREHGDKPIALLPRKFIDEMLRAMRRGARNDLHRHPARQAVPRP